MIKPPMGGSERILTLQLLTRVGAANFVYIYAPALTATPEVKDQFYEHLDSVIKSIYTTEHIFFLADFNARVGADHECWPNVLGHHGMHIGKMNENGQRLLELSQPMCDENLLSEQGMP